jgi:hypothetical protein
MVPGELRHAHVIERGLLLLPGTAVLILHAWQST